MLVISNKYTDADSPSVRKENLLWQGRLRTDATVWNRHARVYPEGDINGNNILFFYKNGYYILDFCRALSDTAPRGNMWASPTKNYKENGK